MEECVTESETELAEGNKTQVDQVSCFNLGNP